MDFDDYCYLSSDEEKQGICVSHHYSSDESDSDDGGALEAAMGVEKSSADSFDAEMSSELDQALLTYNNQGVGSGATTSMRQRALPAAATATKSSVKQRALPAAPTQTDDKSQQYANIYFDSDEDDDDEGVRNHRSAKSDADLFYDPTMDDRDQHWLDKHRFGKVEEEKKQQNGEADDVPASDAVLNCPGCLTTLCVQCQRHSVYNSQYRAIVVIDCKVDNSHTLSYPPTKQTKKEIWKSNKKERQLNKKRSMMMSASEANTDNECDESTTAKKVRFSFDDASNQCANDINSAEHNEQCTENSEVIGSTDTEMKETVSPNRNIGESSALKDGQRVLLKEDVSTDKNDNRSNEEPNSSNVASGQEEVFYSVSCVHCNTKVAVLDNEEVYHFFNVITSY